MDVRLSELSEDTSVQLRFASELSEPSEEDPAERQPVRPQSARQRPIFTPRGTRITVAAHLWKQSDGARPSRPSSARPSIRPAADAAARPASAAATARPATARKATAADGENAASPATADATATSTTLSARPALARGWVSEKFVQEAAALGIALYKSELGGPDAAPRNRELLHLLEDQLGAAGVRAAREAAARVEPVARRA